MNNYMIGAIIVAVLLLVGVISIFFLGDDNVVEETCEKGIEAVSGEKVDLSGPDANS